MGFKQIEDVRDACIEAGGGLRKKISHEMENEVETLGDVSDWKSSEGSS